MTNLFNYIPRDISNIVDKYRKEQYLIDIVNRKGCIYMYPTKEENLNRIYKYKNYYVEFHILRAKLNNSKELNDYVVVSQDSSEFRCFNILRRDYFEVRNLIKK